MEHSWFEDQFRMKKSIAVCGGTIETVDICPVRAKTNVPILFAPGWGGTPEMYKDTLRVFSAQKRRVLSLAHMLEEAELEDVAEEEKNLFPGAQLRKALSLLVLLREKGVDKTDIVAHSEGAINAVIAVSLAPDRFRHIVLVSPAGLIGEDTFAKLFVRFVVSMVTDADEMDAGRSPAEKARSLRALREILKYFGINPIKALKEASAIAEIRTHGMLKNLCAGGHGIAVVAAVRDPVFSMEKLQKMVKRNELDGFLSVKGGHGEIVVNPEQYAAAASNLLDSLALKNRTSF